MNLSNTSIKLYLSILFFGLLLPLLAFYASQPGDFKVWLEAATLLKRHQQLYNIWLGGRLYFYSPLFALILIPFTYVPQYIPNFLFLCADIYFLFKIWKFFTVRIDFGQLNRKEKIIFSFAVALLTLRFLLYNFDYIQMTIFLLWALLESWSLFEKNKNLSGAFLLALAINIKLMPVIFVPYLIYRGKIIPAVLTAVFFIIFLYLPACFIGIDYNNALLSGWWSAINPANTAHLIETGPQSQSLTSFIPTLLMPTSGQLPFKRNIANLNVKTVILILNLCRAFFILLTLYFTGFTIFKNAKTKIYEYWEIVYIVMIVPLIFPHQQKYDFFLIVPAVMYSVYFLIYQWKEHFVNFSKTKWIVVMSLLILSFMLNTLTSDLFIGMYRSIVTQHYRAITYGTILLIFVLALCHPKYLKPGKSGMPL